MSVNGTNGVDRLLDSSALAQIAQTMMGGGADAQADLANAIVRSSVQLTAEGMREAMYIQEACGAEGVLFVAEVLRLKNHQNPGALGKMVDAIKALSLYEHLRGFNLNLGGK